MFEQNSLSMTEYLSLLGLQTTSSNHLTCITVSDINTSKIQTEILAAALSTCLYSVRHYGLSLVLH